MTRDSDYSIREREVKRIVRKLRPLQRIWPGRHKSKDGRFEFLKFEEYRGVSWSAYFEGDDYPISYELARTLGECLEIAARWIIEEKVKGYEPR